MGNFCCLQARARCWLFLSYLVAFAAVAGSVAVLIQCATANVHVMVGVVSPAVWSSSEIKLVASHLDRNVLCRAYLLLSLNHRLKVSCPAREAFYSVGLFCLAACCCGRSAVRVQIHMD